jgi:hypothetical protein
MREGSGGGEYDQCIHVWKGHKETHYILWLIYHNKKTLKRDNGIEKDKKLAGYLLIFL